MIGLSSFFCLDLDYIMMLGTSTFFFTLDIMITRVQTFPQRQNLNDSPHKYMGLSMHNQRSQPHTKKTGNHESFWATHFWTGMYRCIGRVTGMFYSSIWWKAYCPLWCHHCYIDARVFRGFIPKLDVPQPPGLVLNFFPWQLLVMLDWKHLQLDSTWFNHH